MKLSKVIPLLIAGVICSGASAADLNLDFGLKFRASAGLKDEYGVKHGLGANAFVSMPMSWAKGAAITAEFGYQYYTGDAVRVPVAGTIGTVAIDPAESVDFQKTNVEGFNLRAIYSQDFLKEGLSWQAGVIVNRLKSRMDAVGTFVNDLGTAYVGNWTERPEEVAVTPGALAGIKYQFNEAGAIELNVVYATYKQVTVTPVDVAGVVKPQFGSKNIGTMKIEFGYIFRF